jgi:MFS family permease
VSEHAAARLLTARFLTVVACGLLYFTALAMLTPVLPHYVEDSLGNGSVAVGVAVGAFALGAIVLRLYAGRFGDRVGRRVLIIGGALLVAISTALYPLVHALWWLIAMRIVTGFGEAGFFVGAATMVTDLAPPERRGEAVSYWSVAVYGGLAFGPALGELLRGHDRYNLAFGVSAGLALLAAILATRTVEVPRDLQESAASRLVPRGAVRPGFVLFLGLIPLAGFTAFMPLYADHDLGVSSGGVFVLYGTVVLAVRIFGARLPDRMGGRRAGTLALVLSALGVAIIAIWATLAGLLVGTVVFAVGMSFMYPALLLLALNSVADSERGAVVGTVSSFFDASQGIGALACGAVVAITSYRGSFLVGIVTAIVGLALLRAPVRRLRTTELATP